MVLLISSILQFIWQPFNKTKYNMLNNLETLSLLSLCISYYSVAFVLISEDIINDMIIVIFYSLGIISNLIFLSYFLHLFFKHKIFRWIKYFKTKIVEKLSNSTSFFARAITKALKS